MIYEVAENIPLIGRQKHYDWRKADQAPGNLA